MLLVFPLGVCSHVVVVVSFIQDVGVGIAYDPCRTVDRSPRYKTLNNNKNSWCLMVVQNDMGRGINRS